MRPLIKIFALVLTIATAVACNTPVDVDSLTPALLQRSAGLYVDEFQHAEQRFESAKMALVDNPENLHAVIDIARVYSTEAQVTGEHPYYYPAVLRLVDYALGIDKDNVELLSIKTQTLLSLHRFSEARQLAQQLLSKSSTTPSFYAMYIDACVELGMYKEAVDATNTLMRLRPGLDAYARVSYLRELHNDTAGALEAMQLAVKAGVPGTHEAAWTRTTYADLLAAAGRNEEAKEQYHLALCERLNFPFAMAGLAAVMIEESKYSMATALLDSALRMMPEISFVELKARIASKTNNRAEQQRHLETIEKMFNEDAQAGHANHADRAQLYARYDYKLDEAMAAAKREVQSRPNNKTIQETLELCKERWEQTHE